MSSDGGSVDKPCDAGAAAAWLVAGWRADRAGMLAGGAALAGAAWVAGVDCPMNIVPKFPKLGADDAAAAAAADADGVELGPAGRTAGHWHDLLNACSMHGWVKSQLAHVCLMTYCCLQH